MKAYDEGYRDFKKGQLTNPYKEGSKRNKDWEYGFNRAYFRNLEYVRQREARRGSKAVSSKEASTTKA